MDEGSSGGGVVWITGLSGVGKSTIGTAVVAKLRAGGRCCLLVDGDRVRWAVNDQGTEFDLASRLRNAYRVARFAKMLAEQHVMVVVATMSLFHEIHQWNREHLPGYVEVLLRADLEVLRRRDPKGLYAKLHRGEESNVGGVDIGVEMPLAPHLVLDNGGELDTVGTIAEAIVDRVTAGRGR